MDEKNTDILWGARAIGREINRSPRQTYGLLESGALPATKVGATWVSSRRKLRLHVTGDEPKAGA
jgi:hypothetical protein